MYATDAPERKLIVIAPLRGLLSRPLPAFDAERRSHVIDYWFCEAEIALPFGIHKRSYHCADGSHVGVSDLSSAFAVTDSMECSTSSLVV